MYKCIDHISANHLTLTESLEKEKANAKKGVLIEGGLEMKGHFDMSAYSFLKDDPLPARPQRIQTCGSRRNET